MSERMDKIKTHLREKKGYYISAGAGIVVGAVTMVILGKKVSISQKAQNVGFFNWKPLQHLVQATIVDLPARGHRGNVIYCNELQMFFASEGEAARALGIQFSNLSAHLNGRNPHVGGYTFKKIGENIGEQVKLSV